MNTKKEATAVDSKKHFPLLGIVIFTLIIMMIWVCWMMTCDNEQKFQGTGVIGDTIGGLTSPIIGLLGAVLVYISFREQLNANKIQIKALNKEKKRHRKDVRRQHEDRIFNHYEKQIEELKSETVNLTLTYPIGQNGGLHFYDNLLIINGIQAETFVRSKLKDYTSLKNSQKHAIDTYVYKLGFLALKTSLMLEKVSSNKQKKSSVHTIQYNSLFEFYSAYIRKQLEDLVKALDDTNDPKSIKKTLLSQLSDLKKYHPG